MNKKPEGSKALTKTTGKPFQRGDDPRRHKGGSRPKSAVEFTQAFTRAIAEHGDVEALASTLWARALKGDHFAVDTILERTIGKPVQAIAIAEPPAAFRFLYKPKQDDQESPHDETLSDGTRVEGILHRASSEAELDELQKRDHLLTRADIEADKRQKRRMEFSKTLGGNNENKK